MFRLLKLPVSKWVNLIKPYIYIYITQQTSKTKTNNPKYMGVPCCSLQQIGLLKNITIIPDEHWFTKTMYENCMQKCTDSFVEENVQTWRQISTSLLFHFYKAVTTTVITATPDHKHLLTHFLKDKFHKWFHGLITLNSKSFPILYVSCIYVCVCEPVVTKRRILFKWLYQPQQQHEGEIWGIHMF